MDEVTKLGYLAGATRFRRISDKLYIDGNKLYEQAGVRFKSSWFSVFYALSQAEGPLSVSDLAGIIGFSHITVKNIVREMEAAGLVTIKPNPDDKRYKHIMLSAEGQAQLAQVAPLWEQFAKSLRVILQAGHPDILNILARIDHKMLHYHLYDGGDEEPISVLDYRPSLRQSFFDLAGTWLSGLLHGHLEEEDKFTLTHPAEAYLLQGGFVFFAQYKGQIVGCIALKRLDEERFEMCKLVVREDARRLGIATRLVERCISRSRENGASELWLQTTNALVPAHKLYYKMGFDDRPAPEAMAVLQRTEKIMCMSLQ